MEYRHMGRSGLIVSAVGLGTNNFGNRTDAAQAALVLDQCVESGVNFIDTSDTYSTGKSEECIGQWMQGKRDKVLIATKAGNPFAPGPYGTGASRLHFTKQVEGSLRRLQTDYIDLYQIHAPDRSTPIEETLRTLDDLVRAGKIRYYGTSNFPSWQIVEAQWASKSFGLNRPVSEQPQYNLLNREVEREIVPAMAEYGVGMIPYSPLASGLLTGKYKRGESPPPGTRMARMPAQYLGRSLNDKNFTLVEKLQQFSEKREHTIGELAVAWLLANPVVSSVISGATKPDQVVENVKGLDWKLTPDDLKEVDAITKS